MSADFERAGTGYDPGAYGHERQGRRQRPESDSNRDIALAAIDKFCAENGFPVPQLQERDMGLTILFTGQSPDGRTFALGYEPTHPAR